MEAYLDGNEPIEAMLKRCIRKGTIAFNFVPVLCGSAFKNKGVQPLLDAVVDYLPSPLDIPPLKGIDPENRQGSRPRAADDKRRSPASRSRSWTTRSSARSPSAASIRASSRPARCVLNSVKDKRARRPHAADACQQPRRHQRSLCRRHRRLRGPEGHHHRRYAVRSATIRSSWTMEFPEPVIEVAVEPKTKADQEKMGMALTRLAQEDPSFRVSTDQETGQTIIKGMGELHSKSTLTA